MQGNRDERRRTWAAALAVALLALSFAWPMLRGRLYLGDDLGHFHLPLRAFYAGCLARGEGFAWFPAIYSGFDLHGEGQVGLYHPFHLALYRFLPLGTAFRIELFASYPALVCGLSLFLRRWGLPRDASLFGAMVFAFSGFNLLHVKHPCAVGIIAHLPWLLLAADHALRGDDARRVAWARLALGLLTASQLLLGHPQSVWFSGLAEGLYALFISIRFGWHPARLAGWAAAKALGLLAGAIQCLPTLDALGRSIREKPTREYLATGSLPPANLVQWVAPYLYVSRVVTPPMQLPGMGKDAVMEPATSLDDWRTHEFGLYPGAVVPVLLVWLVMRRRALGSSRPLARGALALGLLALALAFGKYGPLFRLTWRLPLLNLFRMPTRYLVLVQLSVAVLAAIGLADLARSVERTARPPWRQLWPLGVLPGLSVLVACGAMLLAPKWPGPILAASLASKPFILAGPLLVLAASVLVALSARGSHAALLGLIVFAALDLSAYSATYLRCLPRMKLDTFLATRALPPGPIEPGTRAYRAGSCWDDSQTIRGLSLVNGYAGLSPVRRLDPTRPICQRVSGANWLDEEDPDGRHRWTRLPDPLPRARLVTRAVVTDDPNRDIATIDPATTALVDRPLPCSGDLPGSAALVADRPGAIDVITEASSRQLLILNESYHPGWRVEVDGHRSRLGTLPVYGDFIGCLVEPGRHRVSLRFAPRSLARGAQLSMLGLGLMASWLAVSLMRDRPRRRVSIATRKMLKVATVSTDQERRTAIDG